MSVGLSDVATGGRLFITVTVLDSATKDIFQTTSGWQHTITCAHCCCQDRHHRQQQQHRRRPAKRPKAYAKTRVLQQLKFNVTAA